MRGVLLKCADFGFQGRPVGELAGRQAYFSAHHLEARVGRTQHAADADLGLQWLTAHQDEDGRWDCDGFMKHDGDAAAETAGAGSAVHDVGATGLAVLAFLGAGNTMRSGPYKDQVKAGVRWLIGQQDQQSGLIGTAQSHDFIYGHAIATWALCEDNGLSKARMLKSRAQRALDYLERHRNPYGVWRYQPRDGDNDTSVTSWCVMAYCAGRDFELEVNDNALKVALEYYEQVTDPETGRHGYTKRGERSSRMPGMHASKFPIKKNEALTGAGLFAVGGFGLLAAIQAGHVQGAGCALACIILGRMALGFTE